LDDRFPNLEIIISPCRVQGEEAPLEIAQAIENLNEYGKVDVIIVGRGGGSIEDLFAFNEKVVADAIYNSHIPIISAVGHEIDQTIADLVADERAPTPSAAAQRVVPRKEDLILKISEKKRKLKNLISRKKQSLEQEILKLRKLLEARHPQKITRDLKQRVDEYRRRVHDYLMANIQNQRNVFLRLSQKFIQQSPYHKINLNKEKIKALREKITRTYLGEMEKRKNKLLYLSNKAKSLSPYSILKRGYSICFNLASGKIVKESSQIKKEDKVKIMLSKGSLYGKIYKVEESKGEL